MGYGLFHLICMVFGGCVDRFGSKCPLLPWNDVLLMKIKQSLSLATVKLEHFTLPFYKSYKGSLSELYSKILVLVDRNLRWFVHTFNYK